MRGGDGTAAGRGLNPNAVTPSQEQIESFRADGHILLRNVVDPGYVSRFRAAVMDAVGRLKKESRPLEQRDTYGRAFIQITNIWEKDLAVREFVLDPCFGSIAARLLGVERVRLYHDQALIKEPNGGKTPWHLDQYYWPLATDATVTVWMPLVDVDEDMGSMSFASGSHLHRELEDLKISDESEDRYGSYVTDKGFPIFKSGAMNAGDCTFHCGRTIHSAGPNLSPTRAREVMTMIYFADGTLVAEPKHANQTADLDAFLGGRHPGEVADSAQNPIV